MTTLETLRKLRDVIDMRRFLALSRDKSKGFQEVMDLIDAEIKRLEGGEDESDT